MKIQIGRLIGVSAVLVIIVLAYFCSPVPLSFQERNFHDIPKVFGYLVLLSLFVERAIEVFLSTWRSRGADELDREIEIAQEMCEQFLNGQTDRVQGCQSEEFHSLSQTLEALRTERKHYKAKSRFIAQWLGLGIGLTLALIGIRVLDNIMITEELTGYQMDLFRVIDVLISGAVIAGGSESFNRFMKLYNRFMDNTATRKK